jgi:hypothetical protein
LDFDTVVNPMANRSYLFSFDEFHEGMPSKPRGVHEWNWSIPLSHLILLSGQPRTYRSSLWKGKIAIVADYSPGVQRFLAFLRILEASGQLDKPKAFKKAAQEAEKFLTVPKERGRFLLLEPGEILAMGKDDLEKQNEKLVKSKIPTVTKQIDTVLTRQPEKLFQSAAGWLSAIRTEWNDSALGLGSFSDVLYYQLDRSKDDDDDSDA